MRGLLVGATEARCEGQWEVEAFRCTWLAYIRLARESLWRGGILPCGVFRFVKGWLWGVSGVCWLAF
jgi:hypothetical protein